MPNAPVLHESQRPRTDCGRATQGWRWFSDRTRRRATGYRDVAWAPIVRQMAASLALIILARLFPAEGFSPFALCGGAVWLVLLVRIAILKQIHRTSA